MSQKFDYILEAVHFLSTGRVDYLRVYERRGPSYSDRIILTRDQLIDALKKSRKAAIGIRLPGQASTFTISNEVLLTGIEANLVLSTDPGQNEMDYLPGIPVL